MVVEITPSSDLPLQGFHARTWIREPLNHLSYMAVDPGIISHSDEIWTKWSLRVPNCAWWLWAPKSWISPTVWRPERPHIVAVTRFLAPRVLWGPLCNNNLKSQGTKQ